MTLRRWAIVRPRGRHLPRRRAGVLAAAMVIGALGLTACLPLKPPPPTGVQISTNPELFPSFRDTVPDYVSRCSASAPVQVSVSAPQGTTVSIAGQPAQGGTFTAQVTRDVGQSFTIVVQAPSQAPSTHYVRCLPANFPTWTAERSGSTQAEWYVTAPMISRLKGYPAIFDSNGVPVWWYLPKSDTVFATLLPDGNIAWTYVGGGAEERTLDGSVVRTIDTVGDLSDFHDLLQLPNGNFVMVANPLRSGVDLSAWGGPSNATVTDHAIQELTPRGGLVWSWDAMDHIPVSETDPQWRTAIIQQGSPYDVYHYNSIEPTATGFVVSFRHLDAVYNVDKATGNIAWKLGGSPRSESLFPIDPVFITSGFGGQHDARVLSDGTLTLQDNASNRDRPPRAVRYQIDTTFRTAMLVEQIGDPRVPSSFCCGSARKLSGGNWAMGWGGTRVITEMTPSGTRVFLLQFDSAILYRAVPIPFGQLSREALRAGMDAQYPSQSQTAAKPSTAAPSSPTTAGPGTTTTAPPTTTAPASSVPATITSADRR